MTSQEEVTDLTKSISKFAFDFYHECAQSKPGNVIVSPLSVATSLALLAQAANGNTLEELLKGLHLTGDKSTIAEQFAEHCESLQKNVGESTLSIVNQIYVQLGHQINKNIQEIAVTKFLSGIDSLDFANAVDSAQIINRFVEEKSKGKIGDLVKPNMLNALTRVVLVNGIYFKGNWVYPFDEKLTKKGNFYINESETVAVDFMNMKEEFNYAVLDEIDATALELKYAFSKLSFVIVLPNKRTGLSALEDKLKNYDLAKIIRRMSSGNVKVAIPKFKAEFEINLNDVLKTMGMSTMFNVTEADLSGLLESKEELYVSNVVHKAHIEVNELGSEAAAFNAHCNRLRGYTGNPDPIFHANHPFVYFIMDTVKMDPIFVGSLKMFEGLRARRIYWREIWETLSAIWK